MKRGIITLSCLIVCIISLSSLSSTLSEGFEGWKTSVGGTDPMYEYRETCKDVTSPPDLRAAASADEGTPAQAPEVRTPGTRFEHELHYETTINHAIGYRDFYPGPEIVIETSYDHIFHTPPDELKGGCLGESFDVYINPPGIMVPYYSKSYIRTYMNMTLPQVDGRALCTGGTFRLTTSETASNKFDIHMGFPITYWDANLFVMGYDIDQGDLPKVDDDLKSNDLNTTKKDAVMNFDVTHLVNEWFTGAPNFGLVIKANEIFTDTFFPIAEYTFYGPTDAADKKPLLILDYIVNNPPEAEITSDPDVVVKEKRPVTLTGTGTDPDGDGISAYLWESDKDGILGTTASISPDNLTLGKHRITFKVKDDVNGFPLWSEERWRYIEVTRNNPEVTGVSASSGGAGGVTFGQGSTVVVQVDYKDGQSPISGWINISDVEGVVAQVSKAPLANAGPDALTYQWDTTGVPRGLYRVDVVIKGSGNLYDWDGLYDNSPDLVINLVDERVPEIEGISFFTEDKEGDVLDMGKIITIEVTEKSGESGLSAFVNITDPNDRSVVSRGRFWDLGEFGKYQFTWNTQNVKVQGLYTVDVLVMDRSGNSVSVQDNLDLRDITPPVVATVEVHGAGEPGHKFPKGEYLTVIVEELYGEKSLSGTMEIVEGDDVVVELEPLLEAGDGAYYYYWDTREFPAGTYGLNVTLSDNWGNTDPDGLGILYAPDVWVDLFIPNEAEARLMVVETHPSPGDLDIPLGSPVWVVFSQPVDPDTLDGQTVPVTKDSDEVTGSWTALESNRVCQFVPSSPWEEDTLYTVTITDMLKSQDGLAADDREFSFRTVTLPPSVFVPPSSHVCLNTSDNMTFTVNPDLLSWVDESGETDPEYRWILDEKRLAGVEGASYTYQVTDNDTGRRNLTVLVTEGDNSLEKTWMVTVFPAETVNEDDTDEDGLPDSWEMDVFGSLIQTGTGDPDGDGKTNLEELAAGTDPDEQPDGGSGWKAAAAGLGALVAVLVVLVLMFFLRMQRKRKDGVGGAAGGTHPGQGTRAGGRPPGPVVHRHPPGPEGIGHKRSGPGPAVPAGGSRGKASSPQGPGSGGDAPGAVRMSVLIVVCLGLLLPVSTVLAVGVGAQESPDHSTPAAETRDDSLRTIYISPGKAFSADVSHTVILDNGFGFSLLYYFYAVSPVNLTVGDADVLLSHPGVPAGSGLPQSAKDITFMWWDMAKIEEMNSGMIEITKAEIHVSPDRNQPNLLPVGAFPATSEVTTQDFGTDSVYRDEYDGPKYVRYDQSNPVDTANPTQQGQDYTFDITGTASKWFSRTFPNFGMIFRTVGTPPGGQILETKLNNPLSMPGTNVTTPCLEIQYRINMAPVASIDQVDPEDPVEGIPFTLSGSAIDPDGHGIKSYIWEFDYGSLGSGPDVTVTLPRGVYQVTLTAWDGHPTKPINSTTVIRAVQVKSLAQSQSPVILDLAAESGGVQGNSFSSGPPITFSVEELFKTTGLVGSLSVTGDDPKDPFVVENAPMTEMNNGLYTYVWDTSKVTTGIYSVDVVLMDPVTGLGDFDGLRPGVDLEIDIVDDLAPQVASVSTVGYESNLMQPGEAVTFVVEEAGYEQGCSGGLEIKGPDVTRTIDLEDRGSGIYSCEWDTTGMAQGTYSVNAWLADQNGNKDDDGVDGKDPDLELTIEDTMPPMVISVSARQEGEWVVIEALEASGEEGLYGMALLMGSDGHEIEEDLLDVGEGWYSAEVDILDMYDLTYDIEVTLWDENNNMDADGLDITPDATFSKDIYLGDPPEVVSRSPEPSAVIDVLDEPVKVEFSLEIALEGDPDDAVYAFDSSGDRVDGEVFLSADGISLTFLPENYWTHEEEYTVVVTPHVQSLEGVPLSGFISWSFSVVGLDPPRVLDVNPEDDPRGVEGRSLQFDMNTTEVDFVAWSVDGQQMQKGNSNNFTWTPEDPGIFKIEATAKNPDGQVSSVWFVKVDEAPPDISDTEETDTSSDGSGPFKGVSIALAVAAVVLVIIFVFLILMSQKDNSGGGGVPGKPGSPAGGHKPAVGGSNQAVVRKTQ